MSSHKATSWYRVPGHSIRDNYFSVPLDYASANGHPRITIFARELVAYGKEDKQLPCLLFLQGGPGFECQRPTDCGGWIDKACEEYKVILLDQRGTGLSTPVTVSALGQFQSPQAQASYLQHFRADNIVRDAEYVRGVVSPNGDPWTILGQSYGGFCAVTYLSFAPTGLHHVLLTGGLPPLDAGCTAEFVYRACYRRVILQNKKYYKRYPEDVEAVQCIVEYLVQNEVALPMGGILSPKGFQLLGLTGLGSSGGFERLHFLLERAWDPPLVAGAKKELSYTFLRMFENWFNFDTNPLYALMHESIYAQEGASNWAAHRVREEFGSQFDPIKLLNNSEPIFFTGEMIFPWMFDEIEALKPFKELAYLLACKDDWPKLYDPEVLSTNTIPLAALLYYEDMYVNFNISEDASIQIKGIQLWVTNEYMHTGLREDGARIFQQLMGMVKGKYLIR